MTEATFKSVDGTYSGVADEVVDWREDMITTMREAYRSFNGFHRSSGGSWVKSDLR